jgi:hypothetical protein
LEETGIATFQSLEVPLHRFVKPEQRWIGRFPARVAQGFVWRIPR